MRGFTELGNGLVTALSIATLALVFSMIPGAILYWAKKGDNKAIKGLAIGFIEFIKGIPLVVQLFIFYFYIGGGHIFYLERSVIAVIVLSLNGMANIAINAYTLSNSVLTASNNVSSDNTASNNITSDNVVSGNRIHLKILSITFVREWGRLVNYTSLLSIMGIAELTRAAKIYASNTSDFYPYFWIVFIYLSIHIMVKVICYVMKRQFFNGLRTV